MSSELLVDVGEDPATDQLGQLKLAPMEDQQWPPDELPLSKSGESGVVFFWTIEEADYFMAALITGSRSSMLLFRKF